MGSRIARRKALWVLLWRAAGWRVAALGTLAVLQGLTPTAAIVASGVLVGAVPAASRDGFGSAAADQALLGLAVFGAVLLAGAALGALADHQVHVLNGRYGGTVHDTVAGATLRTPGIAVLEDPGVVAELAALEQFERADGFVGTATSLRELVRRRATGVGAFIVLFVFAWWAPVVMLAGWRALSYGVRRWLEHGMEVESSVGATRMRRSRYLRSLVVEPGTAKEVRVFALADWLVRGYADSYRAALDVIRAARRLGMRTVLLATSGVVAAHVVVLGVLGWRAAAGTLSVAELTVFAQAVLASSALGYVFGAEIPLARSRQVAWQALRLEQRLAEPADGPRAACVGSVDTGAGPISVRLSGVRFTYPGRATPTLDGLDLAVPAGQSHAIVGHNGAGKSTLIKLLCGLYEADKGVIELAGVPAVHARARIGAIFQNFVRYELPLRANVSFGALALAADEDALTRALSDAGAGELLEAGWETVLSAGHPGGRDLSGGQWQKVALARALAAVHGGAGLLILDEPTANLDVRTEAELFDRFLALTRGVTTILVSHRLASVRRADRIAVIADGRVVEDGSHDELMAAGGQYARMFALQADRFADSGAVAVGTGRRTDG